MDFNAPNTPTVVHSSPDSKNIAAREKEVERRTRAIEEKEKELAAKSIYDIDTNTAPKVEGVDGAGGKPSLRMREDIVEQREKSLKVLERIVADEETMGEPTGNEIFPLKKKVVKQVKPEEIEGAESKALKTTKDDKAGSFLALTDSKDVEKKSGAGDSGGWLTLL